MVRYTHLLSTLFWVFVECIFEILFVIWLALIGTIYSRIASFFALNRIFFPANEEALLIQQPIAGLKKPIKLQENEKQLLQLSTN